MHPILRSSKWTWTRKRTGEDVSYILVLLVLYHHSVERACNLPLDSHYWR